jgi:hypothetical protein
MHVECSTAAVRPEQGSSHFEKLGATSNPLLASLGKDDLALHCRRIRLIRLLTIGMCLTLSLSRSHV